MSTDATSSKRPRIWFTIPATELPPDTKFTGDVSLALGSKRIGPSIIPGREQSSCPALPYAEICVDGTGSVSLNNYRFFGETGPFGDVHVLSFWAEQYGGVFSSPW